MQLKQLMHLHKFCAAGVEITRSQAAARIADRTAKNCKGHMT